MMKLKELKDLISVANYMICKSKMEKNSYLISLHIVRLLKIIIKNNFLFHFLGICLLLCDFFSYIFFMYVLQRIIQFGGDRNKVLLNGHFQGH